MVVDVDAGAAVQDPEIATRRADPGPETAFKALLSVALDGFRRVRVREGDAHSARLTGLPLEKRRQLRMLLKEEEHGVAEQVDLLPSSGE